MSNHDYWTSSQDDMKSTLIGQFDDFACGQGWAVMFVSDKVSPNNGLVAQQTV